MESEIYTPLPPNHIRVVTVQPASRETDTVEVALHAVCLDNPGSYEALSYAWGSDDPASHRTIVCNGHGISITANLFDALCRFRQREEPRRMWIDALCINQNSNDDKSEQVKKMLDIYRHAERTLIWMGRADENADEHVEQLFDLATLRYSSALVAASSSSSSASPVSPDVPSGDGDIFALSDSDMARLYQTVLVFFQRPYWDRAWILQEAMVARELLLVCGPFAVDFTSFYNIYGLDNRPDPHAANYDLICAYFGPDKMRLPGVKNFILHDIHYLEERRYLEVMLRLHGELGDGQFARPPRGWGIMSSIGSFREWLQGECSLGSLLLEYGQQQTSNKRDHIFSLLGLVRLLSADACEREWCESVVDYALPVGEVFRRAAQHIVESYRPGQKVINDAVLSHHILDFLPRCDAANEYSLATWVPNWAVKQQPIILEQRRRWEIASLIPYCARVSGGTLFMSGHIVDTLAVFSSPLLDEAGQADARMYEEVHLYASLMASGRGTVYGDLEAQAEAFWRTIVADNPIDDKEPTDNSFAFKEHGSVQRWVQLAQRTCAVIQQRWGSLLGLRKTLGQLIAPVQAAQREPTDEECEEWARQLGALGMDEAMMDAIMTHAFTIAEPDWPGDVALARSSMTPHHFVVTDRGYFGLAPQGHGIRTGDVVALLAGAKQPWYLRPCGSEAERSYRLLAPGWVCGLMYADDTYYKGGWKEGDIVEIEIH